MTELQIGFWSSQ